MKIARVHVCAFAVSILLSLCSVYADPTCIWDFDTTNNPVETTGQDVNREVASPILDNDCSYYSYSFSITKVEVAIAAPDQWQDVTADVTGRDASGLQASALPLTMYDQTVTWAYLDNSASVHVTARVNENGNASIALSAVTLNSVQSIRFTITATATAMRYLTTSVNGGNGSIDPASDPQAKGSVVLLTAIPDPGYRVQSWSGTDNDASTELTNQVTMDIDKSVSVQFEPAASPSPSPSPSPTPSPSPSPSPTPVSFTLTVLEQHGTVSKMPDMDPYPGFTTVTLSVSPDFGYHFSQWVGNDGATVLTPAQQVSNPLDLFMDSNKNLTAVCLIDTATTSAIQGHLSGRAPLPPEQLTGADINADNQIDVSDLLKKNTQGN